MQLELTLTDTGISVETEEWRQIADFPDYDVSSFGRFRNRITGRIIGGSDSQTGYRNIGFRKAGKIYTKLAHVIIRRFFKERLGNHPVACAENMKHSWAGRKKCSQGQTELKIQSAA